MRKEIMTFLNQIGEITSFIYDLSNIIIRMNKENQTNTKAYDNILMLFQLTTDEELALYTFLKLDTELTIDVAKYLFEKTHFLPFTSEAIINQDKDELIRLRIFNRIHKIINSHPDYFITEINKDTTDIIELEEQGNAYSFLYEFMPILEDTTNINLAAFIDEAIKFEQDKEMIHFLVRAKHYLAFLDPNLENILICNGFSKLPKDFNSRMTTIYGNNLSEEFKTYISNSYGLKIGGLVAHELETLDPQNINLECYKKIIIYTSLLKCGLLYLDNSAKEILYSRLMTQFTDEPIYRGIVNQVFNTADETYANVNHDLNNALEFN